MDQYPRFIQTKYYRKKTVEKSEIIPEYYFKRIYTFYPCILEGHSADRCEKIRICQDQKSKESVK